MDIQKLTDKYNKKIKEFKFPTMGASKEGIESILKLRPHLKELPEDELIYQLALEISDIAFG